MVNSDWRVNEAQCSQQIDALAASNTNTSNDGVSDEAESSGEYSETVISLLATATLTTR